MFALFRFRTFLFASFFTSVFFCSHCFASVFFFSLHFASFSFCIFLFRIKAKINRGCFPCILLQNICLTYFRFCGKTALTGNPSSKLWVAPPGRQPLPPVAGSKWLVHFTRHAESVRIAGAPDFVSFTSLLLFYFASFPLRFANEIYCFVQGKTSETNLSVSLRSEKNFAFVLLCFVSNRK